MARTPGLPVVRLLRDARLSISRPTTNKATASVISRLMIVQCADPLAGSAVARGTISPTYSVRCSFPPQSTGSRL
jgi:hypothetical protein